MIEFGIKDALDVLLVASLLFYVYRLMKESRSLNIFVGIMLFVLIWLFVSQVLEMRLLGSILDKLVSVGVIALIVIFQEDIRRFLYEIGSQKSMRRLVRFFHSSKESQKEANKETIMPIVLACMSMAKKYVGALIVIERGVPLKDIMDTGEEIDAKINQRLIENIFFKNSPLHDGAMVVSNKRIMAAGCILPVSHNLDIPKELGLRHRAALGISAFLLNRSSDLKYLSRRAVMPLPLSFLKRRDESALPSKANSSSDSLPRNWKASSLRKCYKSEE